jgi:hypothetical protein
VPGQIKKQTIVSGKNNPIFTSHAPGSSASASLRPTLAFLQTESGINTLWYGSGARDSCLQYLGLLVSTHRSFDTLADLLRTLKSMHRKRLLQTKLQARLESYTDGIQREANEFITDAHRAAVLSFLSSPQSTIFRPARTGGGSGAVPGQEPLQVEKDPYALPVLPPAPVKPHTGVTLTAGQIDQLMREGAGGSLQLLMLYLRYLSRFSRTFTSVEALLPVVKQLHQEHVERCKQTLKMQM